MTMQSSYFGEGTGWCTLSPPNNCNEISATQQVLAGAGSYPSGNVSSRAAIKKRHSHHPGQVLSRFGNAATDHALGLGTS